MKPTVNIFPVKIHGIFTINCLKRFLNFKTIILLCIVKGIIYLYAYLICYYESLKFLYCVVDSDLQLSKFPCPGIGSNLGLTLPIFFSVLSSELESSH